MVWNTRSIEGLKETPPGDFGAIKKILRGRGWPSGLLEVARLAFGQCMKLPALMGGIQCLPNTSQGGVEIEAGFLSVAFAARGLLQEMIVLSRPHTGYL